MAKKGLKYLVVGAGKMGEAIAYDLAQQNDTGAVRIIDSARIKDKPNSSKAEELAKRLGNPQIEGYKVDASDESHLRGFMKESDVAIGAASYELNLGLSYAAIETGTHFCDLGGNNTVVRRQFELSNEAREKKVKIMPDTGITPGAVSIIAAHGIERIRKAGLSGKKGYPDYLRIRVGGLPQDPKGTLQYQIVFSVQGLINEYIEPVEILKGGKRETVEGMSGLEKNIIFTNVCGSEAMIFEAAHTSGGASTLIETYKGKIKELDCKTLRFPGHFEKVRLLHELGFFDSEFFTGRNIIHPSYMDPESFSPRKMTEQLLEKKLSYKGRDMLLLRLSLGKGRKEFRYEMKDYFDEETGHTAMQRTTGYSAAIIARTMAKNQVKSFGTLRQEKNVPAELFIREWKKRNLLLTERILDKQV